MSAFVQHCMAVIRAYSAVPDFSLHIYPNRNAGSRINEFEEKHNKPVHSQSLARSSCREIKGDSADRRTWRQSFYIACCGGGRVLRILEQCDCRMQRFQRRASISLVVVERVTEILEQSNCLKQLPDAKATKNRLQA